MPEQTEFLARVLATLQNNPTAADIDYLVEAYTSVGYLAAEAEGLAESAENIRKLGEANAYLAAKSDPDRKVTEREAEAIALKHTADLRVEEATAKTKARKLRNLLNSIEQTINAVKFLGRQAG